MACYSSNLHSDRKCIGTGPSGPICPATLSPDAWFLRKPDISTHQHSWLSKTAYIMPHRIETGVRLNARMSKSQTKPTPSCGVQISDSWMSAHHQASETARRQQCG